MKSSGSSTNLRLAVAVLCLSIVGIGCRPSADGLPSLVGPQNDGANSAEIASTTLDLSKQKYIWDIEHTAFELEKKFGAAFCRALRQRNIEALTGFCLPDFSAVLPDEQPGKTIDAGVVRQVTIDGPKPAKEAATGAANATALMQHLSTDLVDFAAIDKLGFRVLDLHADQRDPKTGRWEATFYLVGIGTDPQGTPIEFVSHHRVACRFANDAEIEAGRILEHWRVLDRTTRFSRGPLFEETTSAVGLDEVDIADNWNLAASRVRQYNAQMAVEDYDRDGYLDLAVASADGRWRLLKSDAGRRFDEVGPSVGIAPWADEVPRSRSVLDQAFLATWIDFDNDGFADLLIGDRLFRNLDGERFEDVTERSSLVFGYNPRGCIVGDYDCDGLVDLYVLYQHERPDGELDVGGWVGDDETGAENQLWKNMGDGRFRLMTDAANAGGGRRQTFAATWLFVNDDHFPDLYLANDFGANRLLINDGQGRFRDESSAAGVADFATSMGVAAGDVTGDGRPEIYVANMFSKMGRRIIAHVNADDYPPGVYEQIRGSCAGNRLYSPLSDEPAYREFSEEAGVNQVGWAYAPAMADFDADGFLDLYATTGFLSFQRGKPDG